jgi:hypothetical protein
MYNLFESKFLFLMLTNKNDASSLAGKKSLQSRMRISHRKHVESSANDAERGSFPLVLVCGFDWNDTVPEPFRVDCDNLEEFGVCVSELLDRVDKVLLKHKLQAANGKPA